MTAPVAVLVASDSPAFRRTVEAALAEMDGVSVAAGTNCDAGAPARIHRAHPSLVVLDVDEEEEGPLEILKAIQRGNRQQTGARPVHVIMVSRFTPPVVSILPEALERGHFDHILHARNGRQLEDPEAAAGDVCRKVTAVVARRRGHRPGVATADGTAAAAASRPRPPRRRRPAEAILIGCSTGGPQALLQILPPLCRTVETPVFIVQHIRSDFSGPLAASLDQKCRHRVVEAAANATVEPCHVYVAPGGRHLLLGRTGGRVRLVLSDAPPEHGSRPSADVLFRSAPLAYGQAAVGVILSGMGKDGVDGALALKRAGATVLAQDESSSVVWGMPGSAVKAGAVDRVLPLDEIAGELVRLTAPPEE
jgi:two-component system chemotaxis response regulator CheB